MSSALLETRLTIEAIGEHNVDDWQSLPMLEYSPDLRGWIMPHNQPRVTLTFSTEA